MFTFPPTVIHPYSAAWEPDILQTICPRLDVDHIFTPDEVQEALDLKFLYSVDLSGPGLIAAVEADVSGVVEETSFAHLFAEG